MSVGEWEDLPKNRICHILPIRVAALARKGFASLLLRVTCLVEQSQQSKASNKKQAMYFQQKIALI